MSLSEYVTDCLSKVASWRFRMPAPSRCLSLLVRVTELASPSARCNAVNRRAPSRRKSMMRRVV